MNPDLSTLAYWVGVSNGVMIAGGLAVFAYGARQFWRAWSEGRPKRDKRTGRYVKRWRENRHNSETQ